MKTVQQELARVPADALKRQPSPEDRAREALDWALDNTCLTIPPPVRNPYAWQWDAEDVALHCLTDEGDFRFHVAGERRGRVRIRTAVLSWEDDDGTATWEAHMPSVTVKGGQHAQHSHHDNHGRGRLMRDTNKAGGAS